MKKLRVILVVAVMSVVLMVSASSKTVMLGDVSGDGKITASDARSILRFAATLDEYDEVQFLISDVDLNEKVTAADARAVLRVSAGLDPAFGEITISDDEEASATTEAVATTEPDVRTELKGGIGMAVSDFIEQYGDMIKDGTSDGSIMYHNDHIVIVSDPKMIGNQLLNSITVTGDGYTLNGVYAGMPSDAAKSLLDNAGWTLKSENDTLIVYSKQSDLMKLTVKNGSSVKIELCLAVSVGDETMQPQETTTVPAETTTAEPTTNVQEEPDNSETISVDELPGEAKVFLSGCFGFDGVVNNADNSANDVVLYTDGTNINMGVEAVIDNKEVDVFILVVDEGKDSKTIYLVNNGNKKYCELNDMTLAIIGMKKSNFEFSFNVGSADSLEITRSVVVQSGITYDVYKVKGSANITNLYMVGDELQKITTQDFDGKILTTVNINEFFSVVPENSFSLDGYNATALGLWDLFDIS